MKTTTTSFQKVGLFLVFLLFWSTSVLATTGYYFYVQFANKNNSPYSLARPSEYLSARAIERRVQRAPGIDSTDLPITPAYLSQIESMGIHVHNRSKWMNGATVILADSSKMNMVRALPFVRWAKYTGKVDLATLGSPKRTKMVEPSSDYGSAAAQINQMNGKYLHDLGYRGKGVVVGVLDAGFFDVNKNPAFDSLNLQGRLLGTKDFVNQNSNIYAEDAHGADVMSILAGNLPGSFIGTAPDASYWLIRTEYVTTEYLVETDFWCSGIEFADSVGVDVVNSSLGYTRFNDPIMDYTYADMNGEVSRASRCAALAAKKGIVVCNSAGNEGNKAWHYIGAPADAKGIIAVGGVDNSGISSVFSSYGPSSDNRVKPEVCTMGTSAALISPKGLPVVGDGTSYASPIMAGMMACFLQAAKNINAPSNTEMLLKTVYESASNYATPTAQLGYGIPDFRTALARLPFFSAKKIAQTSDVAIGFDFSDRTIHVRLFDNKISADELVRVYSATGFLQLNQSVSEHETILPAGTLAPGVYVVNLVGGGLSSSHKVVIN
jgi:serine protease AprX